MKIPPLRGGDFQAVGLAYYNGQGVPKDYAEVAKWHRKAAEQGAMDAQYNLAQLYLFGEGVTQDNAEAAKWWRKAADQGYGAVPNLILASRITMATVCLRMRKRLDLTVEALILAPEWHELFAEPEREIARKRLADYNYKVATRF